MLKYYFDSSQYFDVIQLFLQRKFVQFSACMTNKSLSLDHKFPSNQMIFLQTTTF